MHPAGGDRSPSPAPAFANPTCDSTQGFAAHNLGHVQLPGPPLMVRHSALRQRHGRPVLVFFTAPRAASASLSVRSWTVSLFSSSLSTLGLLLPAFGLLL